MANNAAHANAALAIHNANADNMAYIAADPDSTYVQWWRAFTTYVDQRRTANELLPGPKYLTRQNVDRYFSEVVAQNGAIQPASASKAASALQWYSTHRENADVLEPFTVRTTVNSVVSRSLVAQANRFANSYITTNHDAHADLPTAVLSVEDHERVLNYVFHSNSVAWKDFSLSWTNCYVTYMRLDSLRKLRLPDLRCDSAHGPVDRGPNSQIMSYILQPYLHKEDRPNGNAGNRENDNQGNRNKGSTKKNKKRVLGLYRHENFLRCGTSMLAFNLFVRMYDNNEIDFIKPINPRLRPKWQRVPLIQEWTRD